MLELWESRTATEAMNCEQSGAYTHCLSLLCILHDPSPRKNVLFVFRFCINSEVKKVKLIYMGKLIKEGPTNGVT